MNVCICVGRCRNVSGYVGMRRDVSGCICGM